MHGKFTIKPALNAQTVYAKQKYLNRTIAVLSTCIPFWLSPAV